MMGNRMVPFLYTRVTSTFGLLDVDVPLWPRAYGGYGARVVELHLGGRSVR